MVTIQTKADSRAAILLLHEGTGKTYNVDQLPKAVSDAIAGDTICLSAGTFYLTDTLVIDKPITMIGQGQNTIIGGTVNIAMEGNPTLTAHTLDAMRFLNDVIVTKSLSGLKIRKVNFSGGKFECFENVESLVIDRCYVYTFWSDDYLRSATIINSKICFEMPVDPNTTGCNIVYQNSIIGSRSTSSADWQSYNHTETYINCIICSTCDDVGNIGYGYIKNCTLINTLIEGADILIGDYHSELNCYYQGDILGWDQENGCSISKEGLLLAGYLGTDGTVVGIEGGTTPYTLEPNSINVENGVMNVDAAKKVLNVTLKVKAN